MGEASTQSFHVFICLPPHRYIYLSHANHHGLEVENKQSIRCWVPGLAHNWAPTYSCQNPMELELASPQPPPNCPLGPAHVPFLQHCQTPTSPHYGCAQGYRAPPSRVTNTYDQKQEQKPLLKIRSLYLGGASGSPLLHLVLSFMIQEADHSSMMITFMATIFPHQPPNPTYSKPGEDTLAGKLKHDQFLASLNVGGGAGLRWA